MLVAAVLGGPSHDLLQLIKQSGCLRLVSLCSELQLLLCTRGQHVELWVGPLDLPNRMLSTRDGDAGLLSVSYSVAEEPSHVDSGVIPLPLLQQWVQHQGQSRAPHALHCMHQQLQHTSFPSSIPSFAVILIERNPYIQCKGLDIIQSSRALTASIFLLLGQSPCRMLPWVSSTQESIALQASSHNYSMQHTSSAPTSSSNHKRTIHFRQTSIRKLASKWKWINQFRWLQ